MGGCAHDSLARTDLPRQRAHHTAFPRGKVFCCLRCVCAWQHDHTVLRIYVVALFGISMRHICLRQHGTQPFVCGISARSAEIPHTDTEASTALPKAKRASCVTYVQLFARTASSW